MSTDSGSEKDKILKQAAGRGIALVNKTTGKQATITSTTSQGLYYIDQTTGKKCYTTFNQQGALSDISFEVPAKGGAWMKVPTPVMIGTPQPPTTPITTSDEHVARPHFPPSQAKPASSKIELIQSLLKICEGNKEFSMTRSDDSDLILEEKVLPQKFLGITVGSPKKPYRARIWLDEVKREAKYKEIEDLPQRVGVIPPGKGGPKPFGQKASGKAQEHPMADRMRGSIRQVIEGAGWRLFYTN
jgi:hypothetical protein